MQDEETSLYRHWDDSGNLLYVGISIHPFIRLDQHRVSSHWFSSVVRVDIERFSCRDEAQKAERIAIASENPLHNIVYSPSATSPDERAKRRKHKKPLTDIRKSSPLAGKRGEIIEAHRRGETHASLARGYGVSRERIRQIVLENGESTRRDDIEKYQKEIVEIAVSRGLTAGEIVAETGISRGKLNGIVKKHDLRLPRTPSSQIKQLKEMSVVYVSGVPLLLAAGGDRAMAEKLRRYCKDNGIPLPRDKPANDNTAPPSEKAA